MITVRKFWTIVIITIALSFSLLAYADTYWFKGNKVKDKDGTEYLIFTDEHKVQLGFKVDGLNLIPISNSKNDSIRKEIKKKEEAAEKAKKEAEQKEFEKDFNGFISNLLKLSMTLLGILATIVAVGILSTVLWVGFCLYLKIKKS
jgi:hypothetical protein